MRSSPFRSLRLYPMFVRALLCYASPASAVGFALGTYICFALLVCSALPIVMVLWLLLTSCSSLLLRIFFRICLLDASARPPRVLTHSFPLYLPYLPQTIPCSYWTLTYVGVLSSAEALYMISVRQARVLPPSFFRFRLTTDTLDLGYILPTAGRIRDFHPLERALTGRTKQKPPGI